MTASKKLNIHTKHICALYRQKTALDDICLEMDSEMKQPRGSRVFGDCDLLMREVMRYLLSADELTTWDNEKMKRMAQYDKQRKS